MEITEIFKNPVLNADFHLDVRPLYMSQMYRREATHHEKKAEATTFHIAAPIQHDQQSRLDLRRLSGLSWSIITSTAMLRLRFSHFPLFRRQIRKLYQSNRTYGRFRHR
eukprot:GHVO01032012.1.p1 GENE.GHVO01032012.1~~GHVO01032012.1.p1  ORF type:complete len:109 (+),score=2.52 GHVO01032012.1:228-554(+)